MPLDNFSHRTSSYSSTSVLVVEDNQFVAEFVEDILQSLGVNVLIARTGPEAVDIFSSNKDTLQLVILDYSIPGMHASQIVDRFRNINASVKLILASGYEESEIFCDLARKNIDGFLSKPFEVTSFLSLLSDAI